MLIMKERRRRERARLERQEHFREQSQTALEYAETIYKKGVRCGARPGEITPETAERSSVSLGVWFLLKAIEFGAATGRRDGCES